MTTRPLLLCALLLAACATDEEKHEQQQQQQQQPPAPPPPPPPSAPAPTPAPAPPPPPVTAAPKGKGPVRYVVPDEVKQVVFNRLIAKLKEPERLDKQKLAAAIEAKTGADVEEVRKGPIGLVYVVFAPTDPPRGAAEQKRLVEALRAMTEFHYVEPDRLMEAR